MRLTVRKKTFGVNEIIKIYNLNSFEEFFWVNLSSLEFVELKRELNFNLCMFLSHMGHNLYANDMQSGVTCYEWVNDVQTLSLVRI
jgi:hypothetical protein